MKCPSLRSFAFLVCLFCAGGAWAQWLETNLQLPDTFGGLLRPDRVELNPGTGIAYMGGWYSDCVIGADARTVTKVSRISVSQTLDCMCCVTRWNRLYMGFDNGRLLVLDCLQNRVIQTLDSCFWPACYNQQEDKVYMCGHGQGLTVLEGATGSVLARLPVTGSMVRLNPVTNRLYLIDGNVLTVIDCSADTVAGGIGLNDPFSSACCDEVHNKLFGTWPGYSDFPDSVVTVVDGAGDSVIDRILVASRPTTLCFNRANGKVYCGTEGCICVIDAATDSVVKRIARSHASFSNMYCDPLVNRVYCLDVDWCNGNVLVLDGSTDSVISEVQFSGWPECVYADTMNHQCLVPLWSDGRVAVIDGVTGRYDTSLYVGDNGPRAICYTSVSNRTYVEWGDRAMLGIDGATNRMVSSSVLPSNADLLCYVPKHNRLYCAQAECDTAITVIDCERDTVAAVVPVGPSISAMCYCESRDRLYCALEDECSVVAVDCATDSVVASTYVDDYAIALYYDAASDKVYGVDDDACAFIVDAGSNALLATLEVGDSPVALCSDSSGRKVYCANEADDWDGNPSVAVIDAFHDSLLKTIYVAGYPHELVCRRAGNKMYCASGEVITVIDADEDRVEKQIPMGPGFSNMCYDSAADRLYCTEQPNKLAVVDCEYDRMTRVLAVGTGPGPMALNPVRSRLYVGNTGSTSVSLIRCPPTVNPMPEDGTTATLINRQLVLHTSLPAELLDISGRKVAHLLPGRNDMRSVPPGVYFIWAGKRLTWKIVVQH